MKDEDVEKLLRAMPLRSAPAIPETMPGREKAGGRLARAIRTLISIKIPVWQAAAAVLIAWGIWRGLAHDAMPAPTPAPVEREEPAAELEASEMPRTLAAREGFWTLPERYRRMIEAATKNQPGTERSRP